MSHNSRTDEVVTTPPAPPTPPPPSYEGLEDSTSGGIYSDIPDIPTSVPVSIVHVYLCMYRGCIHERIHVHFTCTVH